MKYRLLGRSSLKVSEVSFGCMSLKADNTDSFKVIERAIDYGINFFDTADLYEFGLNEKLLGKALAGKRHELIIASKVGNEWNEAKDGWRWNPSKDYILKAIDASLTRLGSDYIDLYQLHGGTIEDPIDETIEAFELLKEAGKIREYGISSIRPNVIREYAQRSNIVSVMIQYSLLDRRPEEACFDYLDHSGISMITRGSLAKGLLAGKAAKPYLGYSPTEIDRLKGEMSTLAKKSKQNQGQLATGYVLQNKAVASAVIGFRTEEQVTNLLNGLRLPDEGETNFDTVRSTIKPKIYEAHR